MKDKKLKDLLPELGQVVGYDFENFRTCWRDNLVNYARVFDKLLDILMMPSETEDEAVKVIEDYLASRQREYGHWYDASWLAFMLGQVIERAKKRQRRKRHKPLADDELPF
jgi:hypothetical protein